MNTKLFTLAYAVYFSNIYDDSRIKKILLFLTVSLYSCNISAALKVANTKAVGLYWGCGMPSWRYRIILRILPHWQRSRFESEWKPTWRLRKHWNLVLLICLHSTEEEAQKQSQNISWSSIKYLYCFHRIPTIFFNFFYWLAIFLFWFRLTN